MSGILVPRAVDLSCQGVLTSTRAVSCDAGVISILRRLTVLEDARSYPTSEWHLNVSTRLLMTVLNSWNMDGRYIGL